MMADVATRFPRCTMLRAAVTAGLILIVSASSAAASVEAYRTPGKDWVKGPVRWLLSDDEEKEWKKQTTDEARAAFIGRFWEKRDPTPGTPENEFEVIFWKRVEEADKAFKVAIDTDPGSLTDMGRAFLLLGPPAATSKDARGRSLWKYEPNPVTGMTETLELTFAPSATGAPLLLSRKVLETYVAAHPATRGIGWKIPEAPAAELVPAGAEEEAPAEDTPESRRQQGLLDELLAKGGGPARVPFQVTYDFYAAVDGSTLTAITLEAPREAAHGGGDAALRPFARLVPQAEGGRPVNLTGDLPFVPASDSPASSYIYQARRNLKPGAWKIAILVEDKVIAGQTGTLVADLRVPDFSDKTFALSSVALLAGFRQVGADVGPDEESHGAGPYVLGSFRLVPRAVPVLARQDALAFYYQVYNPTIDPASGRPNLEVSYAFFLKDGAGWKPFRKPIVKTQRGQVELYAIDLKDFLLPNQPLPADFRMDVTIVDGPTRSELKRTILFSVR
jgi:GWxTD domain-containing protein